MGRAKYSPEMVNGIMAAFVTAAQEIIREEGVEAASIRRVSTKAGYSSGTLYLYFEDMDELVTMALITYLDGYVHDLIETTDIDETPSMRYARSWRLFCKHGLTHPVEFLKLFFGPNRDSLDTIAKRYYELFPGGLQSAEGIILSMLVRGNLLERNRAVLEPLATELGLSEREVGLANDLTISHFRTLLMFSADHSPSGEEVAELTRHFLEAAFFVLRADLPE